MTDSLIEMLEGLKLSETTPKRTGINIGLSLAQAAIRQIQAAAKPHNALGFPIPKTVDDMKALDWDLGSKPYDR